MLAIKINPECTGLKIGVDEYLHQPTSGIHHLNHGMATSRLELNGYFFMEWIGVGYNKLIRITDRVQY